MSKITAFSVKHTITYNDGADTARRTELEIASNGDIYFTDQGQTGMHDPTGRVYRFSKNGDLRLLVDNGPSPNGLVLNPDENILYVGMTRGNAAWRIPLLPDGSTSKVSIYIQLSGGHGGPDGLAMDSTGGLLIFRILTLGCKNKISIMR